MTGACPDCHTQQEVGGSVTTCSNGDCELVAPTPAFTNNAQSSNQAPAAWTFSGSID